MLEKCIAYAQLYYYYKPVGALSMQQLIYSNARKRLPPILYPI
jgi:hypothetical protein